MNGAEALVATAVSAGVEIRLLHLGVGLANGLTNLHNARRAFTPVLNIIGDQKVVGCSGARLWFKGQASA